MKSQRILIVENEAILYERMRRALLSESYEVLDFTPSYEIAIKMIIEKMPNLVLIDIDLDGDKTGLDLGRTLNIDFKIPFIYITGLEEDRFFYEGLITKHSDFIIKTKPTLDIKEVTRAIMTVLNNSKTNESILKHGIFGLKGYLEDMKNFGVDEISKVLVDFNDILFFTNREYLKGKETINKLKTNYICFVTNTGSTYLLKNSLTEIIKELPPQFARINESYLINLFSNAKLGKINGKRLVIDDNIIKISETYRADIQNKLANYYL